MRHVAAAFVIVTVAVCAPADAHHSYGAYDREHPVSVEGTVRAVAFRNPHVLIELLTDDRRTFHIEWSTAYRLTAAGVSPTTLKRGDRIVVAGYVMRDPAQRRMSLVRMVRRVSDGWQWGETPGS